MTSRTSTPGQRRALQAAQAARAGCASGRGHAISSPVSSTNTSSRLAGRALALGRLAVGVASRREHGHRGAGAARAQAGAGGLGLHLGQPRRRRRRPRPPRGRRARSTSSRGRAAGDRACPWDMIVTRVGQALGLLDVVRGHQDRRRPRERSRSISAHSSWRTCGSRPTVGSSSSTSRGWCTSARAISSRRRMPPESLSTLRVAAVGEVRDLQRALDRGRGARRAATR